MERGGKKKKKSGSHEWEGFVPPQVLGDPREREF